MARADNRYAIAPVFDLEIVRRALKFRVEAVARHCLGEPNSHLSTRRQLRFGGKGSLAVEIAGDKAGQWFDHAEGRGGDLFELIRRTARGDFRAAIAMALDFIGEPPEPQRARRTAFVTTDGDKRRKKEFAKQIWGEAVPAQGTLVETYLGRRRLSIPVGCEALRFHPACPRGKVHVPAMVAAMRSIHSAELVGIHRTYLTEAGCKARLHKDDPAKAMLGQTGAVMLDDFAEVTGGLHISEGIENGLVARCNDWGPVWALGSAGAVERFPVLEGIESLTILADADQAGQRSARLCGQRWAEAGAEVRIVEPLTEGADWADELAAVRA